MSEVMQIPEGWKPISFGEAINNKTKKVDSATLTPIIDLEHIEQETGRLILNSWQVDYPKDKVAFDEGDILFGKLRPYLKKFWFCSFPGACTSELLVMQAKKSVDSKFVFYIVHTDSFMAYADRFSYGTKMPRVSMSDLKSFSLAIPESQTEQHRITEILSTLDRAIEASEKLIAKEKQIKKGLMHDLLTHGIDEAGRIRTPQTHRYQESELGMIPEGWKISRIDNVIGKIEQGWSPECDSDVAGFTEWGVLKTSAVKWEGFTREENKRLPSQMKPKPEYQVQVGDLLMTRAGPNSRVGVVALVNSELGLLMLSDKLYRLKPNYDIINNVFLALALSSNGTQRYLESYKTGLAESQTNISQAIVKKLLIVVPEISEQQRIADIITAQDKEIETEETNLAKLKELKKGLMDDLLSGRVRV